MLHFIHLWPWKWFEHLILMIWMSEQIFQYLFQVVFCLFCLVFTSTESSSSRGTGKSFTGRNRFFVKHTQEIATCLWLYFVDWSITHSFDHMMHYFLLVDTHLSWIPSFWQIFHQYPVTWMESNASHSPIVLCLAFGWGLIALFSSSSVSCSHLIYPLLCFSLFSAAKE